MKLFKRFFTGAVLFAGVFFILFWAGKPVFCVAILFFVGAALFEFFTLLRESKVPSFRLFGVAIGLVIPVLVSMEQGSTHSGEVIFLILACLFLFLLQFTRTDNSQALVGIALTLFGILYVSWFLSFLIKMRFLPGGSLWVGYLIAVTKAGDIGAYCFGSLAGRTKLLPHVSPNKTVEGFWGGLFFSVLVAFLLRPFLPIIFNRPHALLLGVIIGLLGQIGDLSESLMKRFCAAKDSGRLLPGMGGVLDIVDSILFTAPIFYFHLKIFYPAWP